MSGDLTNWAGNYRFGASRVHRPTTVEEVREAVAGAAKVRTVGTRHSFNGIGDSIEALISTEGLNRIIGIDPESNAVTIEAGVRYGELGRWLHEHGRAVPNLASLPHISVAGACATATHGSGVGNACLADCVSGVEIVTANGTLVRLKRGDLEFDGAVVNLGALGTVVQMTLDTIPTFDVRQEVFEGLPFQTATEHFTEVMSGAYSVSLFTDWKTDRINQVWTKSNRSESLGFEYFGAKAATVDRHPIMHIDPVNCTPQLGVPGPWHERLAHFRFEYTPSAGEELQAEYLVPFEKAVPALLAVNEMRDQIAPLLQISEIRAIARDEQWMSPFNGQPCVGIHFTLVKDWEAVRHLLPKIEAQLEPFGARPHWGKLSTMPSAMIRSKYLRLADFMSLARAFDPHRKFWNPFLEASLSES